jgi:hypothetical protein
VISGLETIGYLAEGKAFRGYSSSFSDKLALSRLCLSMICGEVQVHEDRKRSGKL